MLADDVASPERLQIQIEYLRAHPDVSVLGGAYELIDDAGRMLTTIVPPPDDATLSRLVAGYGPNRDIRGLLKAIVAEPAFRDPASTLVKQPVEWAVGAMRQLGIRPAQLPAAARTQLTRGLTALGQTPFAPTSVGGWPAGAAWLSTSATEHRVALAALLAGQAARPVLDGLSAGGIDGLARLLVVDGFTQRTKDVLSQGAPDPRRLIVLGLASPEYAVS